MKKKRLISILLSALLIVSVACPPFAGMSVYAAEEVAGSAATSEEAEIAEEEAEEAEIIEKDAAEPEEPAVDEIAGIDDSIEDIGDEEAVQNEEESLQDNEVETSEELVQEVIEEASDNDSDDEPEGCVDDETETESTQNSVMADNSDNADNNYVAQAILTDYKNDDLKFTFYYGPLVAKGDTFSGQVVKEVFSGKEVTDTGYSRPSWYNSFEQSYNNLPIKMHVTSVVFDSSFIAVKPTSTCLWFYGFDHMKDIDLRGLNTSDVTMMSLMFYNCKSLKSIDLSGFDTSNVTTMNGMFYGCHHLENLDLSSFDTSNVKNMGSMFFDCSGLTSLDISTFDTSNVTNMERMFMWCSNLYGLDLSGFDTSNVTTMEDMFFGCNYLKNLDLISFDTSNVTSMKSMFEGCESMSNLDLSGFDTSNVTTMSSMFYECKALTSIDLSGFNTSNVTTMSFMFYECKALTSIDLSNFDTTNITQMTGMFSCCENLKSFDLSSFDTSSVTVMDRVFEDCGSLTSLDLSTFDTSNVVSTRKMFSGCSSLTSLDLSSFDTSKLGYCLAMFASCENLRKIYCSDITIDWSKKIYIRTTDMFSGCTSLIGVCGNITVPFDSKKTDESMAKSADLGGYFTPKTSGGSEDPGTGTNIPQAIWTQGNTTLTFANIQQVTVGDTYNGQTITNVWSGADVTATGDMVPKWIDTVSKSVTNVVFDSSFAEVRPTSTYQWFANCGKITNIDLTGLDTSEVTDMYEMFFVCGSLTNLDVSGFDTSKATSMAYMFSGCSGLTGLDVTGFQTSNVTDMTGMFNGCSSLTSLDVSGFDTAKTTSFSYMFAGCSGLTALDVSRFKTSSVEGIAYTYMFSGCSNLTGLDVSSFDISNVTKYDSMFADCSSLAIIYCADSTTNWSRKPGKEMFRNCVSLAGTSYDTTIPKTVRFDSSKIDSYMAASADFGDGGYFTPKEGSVTDNKCGENAFWVMDEDGTLIIRGTGPMYDYDGIDNVAPWSSFVKKIKVLKVEEGITYIGDRAFSGLSSLTGADLSSSVTEIGKEAFLSCGSLKEIVFPANTISLKEGSFSHNEALKKVFIPESLEQIEKNAFNGTKTVHICYEGDKTAWLNINIDPTGNDAVDYTKSKVHFNARNINDFPQKDWWGFPNYKRTDNHYIDKQTVLSVLGKNVSQKVKLTDEDTSKGLCAGMVETAMLFDQGFLSHSNFAQRKPPTRVYDLEKAAYNSKYDMTAEEMIKLAFLLQWLPDFQQQQEINKNNLSGFYSAVHDYMQAGTNPVYVDIKCSEGDHALWAYALEEEDEYCDIYVYDCNQHEYPQIIRLQGKYPSFNSFKYLNPDNSYDFYDLHFASHINDVKLALYTYHYLTPDVPYISLREKGFLLLELWESAGLNSSSLEDVLIPIVISNGEGSNERNLYYCRSEEALSLQNNTDTPQTVSFTDDVCTMEIELPKGASAEYKDYQLTASCPEGETIAGTYTSVEGEELIDISFTGSASENAKFDFSGEELVISGQPELRIEANYNDSLTSTSVKANQDGAIHIKTDTVNEEDIRLIISVDNDNDGDSEEEKNYNLSGDSTFELTEENTDISFDPKGTVNNSADDPHYPYTGKAVEPDLIVKTGDTVLTKEVDYTVSYADNTKSGIAKVTITGIGNYTGTVTKTFLILPGKTTRGDMFNLANNVKVTWKEVSGAKYYKVYREGVTDKKESRKEPVIVTTGLVGWDKDPGLTNGHAYRYKIVASLTGKGDPSGDSTLSYSKVMYRLKTVVIRSVKNTAPGKVTVKYDKTTSGDSYVLQYCERQDMVGAKTKVVLGANNTSYVIGGLKKGKTYYISIRVRKKVNGIDYYTTFGVPKKVTVTK